MTRKQKREKMATNYFNWGFEDGKQSGGFSRPIHSLWKKDENGALIHNNPEFLRGYKEGFKSVTGINLK